jgi:hypothetical protein
VVHARDLKPAPLDQVNECTSIGPFRVEASGLAYRIQGAVEVQHHCYRFDVLTGVPNHAHPLSEAILKKKDAWEKNGPDNVRKLAAVTGDILKWLESLRSGVLAIRWVHVAPCGTKEAGFVYLAPEVLGSLAAAPAAHPRPSLRRTSSLPSLPYHRSPVPLQKRGISVHAWA